jgi:hypothetical protein
MTGGDIIVLCSGMLIGMVLGAVISYRSLVSVKRIAEPIWQRMYEAARADVERLENEDHDGWRKKAQVALQLHSRALDENAELRHEISELKQQIEDLKHDHMAALESMGAN